MKRQVILLAAALCACGIESESYPAEDAGAPSFASEDDAGAGEDSPGRGERPTQAPDEAFEVVYHGQPAVAERYGSLVLVEGDITVTDVDLHETADVDGDRVNKSVSRQGITFRWPNGVVPFRFGTYSVAGTSLSGSLTAAQRADIRAAMTDIQRAVPGLRFRARTSNDANFITFNLATVCSSRVGRNAGDRELTTADGLLAGEQIIRYTAGCINSFSRHHEIMHALGIYHEQTRRQQVAEEAVRINWRNIQGCPGTATGPGDCGATACSANPAVCGCASPYDSPVCDQFVNFQTDAERRDMFAHDFDSVMHYGVGLFSKGVGDSFTVLAINPATGVAFVPGQRDHLSTHDIEAMQALYPRLRVQPSVFARTGTRRLCQFQGRSQDANTNYTVTGGLPAGVVSGANVATGSLAERDYAVSCSAVNALWANNYGYPATTRTLDPNTQSAANREAYRADNATVRVLSPGLIPLLF